MRLASVFYYAQARISFPINANPTMEDDRAKALIAEACHAIAITEYGQHSSGPCLNCLNDRNSNSYRNRQRISATAVAVLWLFPSSLVGT
ncbi:hypothetical protein BT69DRAFT_1279118 [Atractiella rhizophila]|nr:hypothetical protein BT69DRAFT_1279118 [Atractiella rhizophila]